jgi:phosphohistidine phosphatase
VTVYLVRHAIAEARGPAWPDDDERPLTARGMVRLLEVARRLAERDVRVDLILTSPLVRARQTAEHLHSVWRPEGGVEELTALAPGHRPSQVTQALVQYPADHRLALVGHEPDLGTLAAWMIGAAAPLPFRKAGVARVDFDEMPRAGTGRLVWLVTPKIVLGA